MAKKFKHKKLKNTGLLYELLIRQMTSDVLKGKEPVSINLIKKYFKQNSPLREELRIYNQLLNIHESDSNFALKLVDTAINLRESIDKTALSKDKYNLVKDINNLFEKDILLKTPVEDYKVYASIYSLLEYKEEDDPSTYLRNKLYVANYIMNPKTEKKQENKALMEGIQPELKSLTFKLLIEKFNNKFNGLTTTQKEILRHFIYNSTDSKETKQFIAEQVDNLSINLGLYAKSTDNEVIKIKLNEAIRLLPEVKNAAFINQSHYLALIHYHELLKEMGDDVK